MFVKQAHKATLVETFEEAIRVEKISLTYEPERSGKMILFLGKELKNIIQIKIKHLMLNNSRMLLKH